MSTRVAVVGAKGRMGSNVVAAVTAAEDLVLHAALDVGDSLDAIAGADVCVDFTVPAVTLETVRACTRLGVACVVGTTGWTPERLDLVRDLATTSPVLIVPNFNIGAVLLVRFSELAAPWFDSVEIIELHHPDKVDAPSGTARHTAAAISRARSGVNPDATLADVSLEGARGAAVDGVPIHSVRLRGLIAHQEVLFGTQGETLTLRHDALDRVSFMPGVLLAIRTVRDLSGLAVGLDSVLGV